MGGGFAQEIDPDSQTLATSDSRVEDIVAFEPVKPIDQSELMEDEAKAADQVNSIPLDGMRVDAIDDDLDHERLATSPAEKADVSGAAASALSPREAKALCKPSEANVASPAAKLKTGDITSASSSASARPSAPSVFRVIYNAIKHANDLLSKNRTLGEPIEPQLKLDSVFSIDLLSDAQLESLRRAFDYFDRDGAGSISTSELVQVFQLVGHSPRNVDVSQLMRAIDTNSDGKVDFKEFANAWWLREQAKMESDLQDELELAFEILDRDRSGHISREELRSLLCTTGEKMTDQEVGELLAEADVDGNGMISLAEFRDMKCWRG